MYQGLAASTRRAYSCVQEKFANFCVMTGHLSPYGSLCPASECGPFAFLPRTLLFKVCPFAVRLFLSLKDTLTPWKNCLRLQRVVKGINCSQSAFPYKPQLPISGNILRIIYYALDLHPNSALCTKKDKT